MSSTAPRRSIMTLYSNPFDIDSHRVRIVFAEKAVNVEITDATLDNLPQEVKDCNPYKSLPTLIDRDLVLYDARIIMEYIDERFPHPPLLPVYPVARAKTRLLMQRIENDWYPLLKQMEQNPNDETRDALLTGLVNIAPAFAEMPFCFSEEFSLLDCCMVPLLWRLPGLNIELPNQAKPLKAYAQRMFERPAFKASLTEVEREIREPLHA